MTRSGGGSPGWVWGVCARARATGLGGRCELRAHRTPTSKQGNPQ